MNQLKQLFSKRYFAYFGVLFVIWYPASFILFSAYNATQDKVIFLGLNMFYPLVAFILSFLYFRKRKIDWDERFAVAIGWVAMTEILAILLVEPMYGLSWTTMINWNAIISLWIPVIAILSAGLLQKIISSK